MTWDQEYVISTLGGATNLWVAGKWAQLIQLSRRAGGQLLSGSLEHVLPALGRPMESSQAPAQVVQPWRNNPPWIQNGQGTGWWLHSPALLAKHVAGAGKSKIKPTRTRREKIPSLQPCLYCALFWPSFPSWSLCEINGLVSNNYQGAGTEGWICGYDAVKTSLEQTIKPLLL